MRRWAGRRPPDRGRQPFVAVALVGTFRGLWPISLYIILACAVTFGSLMAAPRPVTSAVR